ncbi:MAG: xanthine dehydrogenase family protein subunit M [Nitrososphaerota archaeon]|nr:xanthine dehydrogenase family protein subunit M [Nitrososphaerota archaeon]
MSSNELQKFGYIKATSISDAVSILSSYGTKARVVAGGTDIITQMKNGITHLTPQYLVDVTGLGLNYVRFSQSDGLRIGATTPLSAVESNTDVASNFAALAQSASYVGSPQIRNQATMAGDVLQEVWCWYLRNNYDCWRNAGTICYAAFGGDNRYYHSVYGGNLCYAVHASDISTALFAFDADASIAGPGGVGGRSMDQLIQGVSIVDGLVKENSLRYNELLTEFHVPTPSAGTKSAFYKVRDRGSVDFALASVAVRATFNGGTVSDSRVVLGGLANKPLRAHSAEDYLNGKSLSEDVISTAADNALEGATPLTEGTGNAFRVDLAKGAVKKALRSLT